MAGISTTHHSSQQPAVDGLDLDIRPGEFVTLLGPSGCAKSPTLRIVAGLEDALALVGMSGHEDRPASMLSSGQQQRVALARAIVTGPTSRSRFRPEFLCLKLPTF